MAHPVFRAEHIGSMLRPLNYFKPGRRWKKKKTTRGREQG